jgi:electron transfer flavoprotein alpha subunit
MAVLLLAEHDNKSLAPATAKALTAARAFGGDVDILVVGDGCKAVAEAAAKLEGVRKVLLAEAPHLAQRLAEETAAAVLPLMQNYSVLLAPSTTMGKNVLPRVAALLDVAQISDIIEVKSPNIFIRPVYAGNALETVETSDKIVVGTVRTTAFATTDGGGNAAIETAAPPAPTGLSSFEGSEISVSERPELTPPASSSPAAAACSPATTSRNCSSLWPTGLAPRLARAEPPSMPAICRTIIRWVRPARWLRPSFTSPSAFPARSSTSPA